MNVDIKFYNGQVVRITKVDHVSCDEDCDILRIFKANQPALEYFLEKVSSYNVEV